MKISLIAAVAKNGVIGHNNKLIWHLSEDLKRFKKITNSHHIILGRKNYDSIGFALPNRSSVILSRQIDLKIKNCVVVHSFEEAISVCKGDEEIFVIGGAEIYRLALESNKITNLYITFIERSFGGGTLMPKINYDNWKIIFESERMKDKKSGIEFFYRDFTKINV